MEQTVRQVAESHGTDLAITWADHRTECLESDIRRLRQALRAVSDAIIAGDPRVAGLAVLAREMLDDVSD